MSNLFYSIALKDDFFKSGILILGWRKTINLLALNKRF